jgi:uncharacterized membrane protein (DUF4010 family)
VPLQVEQAGALAVALGIGLLLGVERERRKGEGLDRAAAGVRTFALVTFLGSLSTVIPVPGLPILVGAFVGLIAVVSYARTSSMDPGTTTEIALMVAYLFGMLTQSALSLAASLAVVITIVLASRDRLHRFVTDILTEDEFRDALLLAAVALVVLPLVPDVGIGPFHAFNPFTTWRFVVIVMLANAAGYIAQRILGAGVGLPIAGFFGGFVSSTATIAAMGSRAKGDRMVRSAVAGAVLSNIATILQLGAVVGSTSPATLLAIAPSLALGGMVAAIYGAALAAFARDSTPQPRLVLGKPFEFRTALVLGAMVSAIMFGSTVLLNLFGETGAMLASGFGLRRPGGRARGGDLHVVVGGLGQARPSCGGDAHSRRRDGERNHQDGGCLRQPFAQVHPPGGRGHPAGRGRPLGRNPCNAAARTPHAICDSLAVAGYVTKAGSELSNHPCSALPALTLRNFVGNQMERSSTHDVQDHSGSPRRQPGIKRLIASGAFARANQRRIDLVAARCAGVSFAR